MSAARCFSSPGKAAKKDPSSWPACSLGRPRSSPSARKLAPSDSPHRTNWLAAACKEALGAAGCWPLLLLPVVALAAALAWTACGSKRASCWPVLQVHSAGGGGAYASGLHAACHGSEMWMPVVSCTWFQVAKHPDLPPPSLPPLDCTPGTHDFSHSSATASHGCAWYRVAASLLSPLQLAAIASCRYGNAKITKLWSAAGSSSSSAGQRSSGTNATPSRHPAWAVATSCCAEDAPSRHHACVAGTRRCCGCPVMALKALTTAVAHLQASQSADA